MENKCYKNSKGYLSSKVSCRVRYFSMLSVPSVPGMTTTGPLREGCLRRRRQGVQRSKGTGR